MNTTHPPHRLARPLATRTVMNTLSASMPRNMPWNDAPEVMMIGTCIEDAMPLASMVLPVPGGPTINTPRSRLPPALT